MKNLNPPGNLDQNPTGVFHRRHYGFRGESGGALSSTSDGQFMAAMEVSHRGSQNLHRGTTKKWI